VLFEDREGLAALVHGVLRAAPIDARAALAKRVLVVGGGSLIPGLETRLLDELRALGVDAGVLTAPCASCDAAWVGASLLAAATPLAGAARGDALPDLFAARGVLPEVVAPQCVSDK
jgi:actin-related protein